MTTLAEGAQAPDFILESDSGGVRSETFGGTGQRPVSADYDGDGLADLATYSPATGLWSVRTSGVVPEPSGLVSLGIGAAIAAGYRLRRGRRRSILPNWEARTLIVEARDQKE